MDGILELTRVLFEKTSRRVAVNQFTKMLSNVGVDGGINLDETFEE